MEALTAAGWRRWRRHGLLRALALGGLPALMPTLAPAPAFAQANERVIVEYRLAVAGTQTVDDARRTAVEAALAEAVRRVVGTEVAALQQSLTTDKGEVEERFLSLVRTSAAGRVVDFTVTREGLETIPGAVGRSTTVYAVTVQADVARERGNRDPGFSVTLKMDRPVYADRGRPERNDEIVAEFTVTQDAYVTIFGVSDDTVQVLWPNAFARDNRVAAGVAVRFPSADMRRRGIVVNAELPPGRDRVIELYAVVATKRPIPFLGPRGASPGGAPTVRGTLTALNRWLVNIPLDERAVAHAAYEVRRQVGSNPDSSR